MPLSSTGRTAILSQSTNENFIVLLEITHADLAGPIRLNRGSSGAVSHGGDSYLPFPFNFIPPREEEGQATGAKLTIDAIDGTIVAAIRLVTSGIDVVAKIVLLSSPETVERGPWNFIWKSTSWTGTIVTGELSLESLLYEVFPGDAFTPNTTPALF